jgi:hypothetical protein
MTGCGMCKTWQLQGSSEVHAMWRPHPHLVLTHCACCCCCRLMPGVEKVARAAADPELRDVATAAIATLERVSKEGQEAAAQPEAAKAETQVRGGGLDAWGVDKADLGVGGGGVYSSCAQKEGGRGGQQL